MQRALIIRHVPFEGPGAIATWLTRRDIDYRVMDAQQPGKWPALEEFDWLIIMGGPMSARDDLIYPWMREEKKLIRQAMDAGHKVLGICLGAQLIASVLGSDIRRNPEREVGWFSVTPTRDCPVDVTSMFADSPPVLHWHGETFTLPRDARHLFSSEACAQQGFIHGDKIMGLQFHLECDGDTLAGLCEHCAADLAPGPWVQPQHKVLVSEAVLAATHQRLYRLLTWFADTASASDNA